MLVPVRKGCSLITARSSGYSNRSSSSTTIANVFKISPPWKPTRGLLGDTNV